MFVICLEHIWHMGRHRDRTSSKLRYCSPPLQRCDTVGWPKANCPRRRRKKPRADRRWHLGNWWNPKLNVSVPCYKLFSTCFNPQILKSTQIIPEGYPKVSKSERICSPLADPCPPVEKNVTGPDWLWAVSSRISCGVILPTSKTTTPCYTTRKTHCRIHQKVGGFMLGLTSPRQSTA